MKKTPRGMTFIEMLVGVAMILIVFLAIFGAFQLSIELVFSTKAKTGAVALVNEKMEYIRGLSYDAIGTAGGIPSGTIPQTEQKNLNGISYTLSTLVQYVDDPSDGTDLADTNGITADYKLVKVQADWLVASSPRSTFVVTKIAPPGIEVLSSGGTLQVNVFDALAAPIQGATVRVVNPSTTPPIDVSIDSNSAGTVSFPGTPVATNYQISLSKSGYSTTQTYNVSAQNPNPNPGNVAILNKKTSTASFSIDLLGSLAVSTWSPVGSGSFSDTFSNQLQLSATTSTTVSGGSLRLTGASGSYGASGSAYSIDINPAYLASWSSISWTASTSAQASLLMRVYYWNGSAYALVPDAALAGNAAGFTTSPISIVPLPIATYGRLQLAAFLSSSDNKWTPEVLDWTATYQAGPTPLPNILFSIHGAKTIGTDSSGAQIYKMNENDTTNAGGVWNINPIEWDTYTPALPSGSSYAVAEQCPSTLSVSPAQSATVALTLQSATANTLRVVVTGNGNPVAGATVTLTGASANTTSTCGQTFWSGLSSGTKTLTVTASGFQTFTDSNVSVSGTSNYSVTLTP